jgi:hypothetical protein
LAVTSVEQNELEMQPLPGNSLLVGLTYVDADGAVRSRRQFLGQVLPAEPGAGGVRVRAPDGEVIALPDAAAVLPAPRGRYRSLDSGETFADPDFLTSWRIRPAEGVPWEAGYAPLVGGSAWDEWDFTYRYDPAHLRRLVDGYAGDYLGKRVRAALQVYQTAADGAERFLGEEERAGRLVRVSVLEGAVLVLDNGKEFRLPPDLALLQPAPPGAAGHDRPDLLTRWTVYRNAEDED